MGWLAIMWSVWAGVTATIARRAREDWVKAETADDRKVIMIAGGCFALLLASAAVGLAIATWG